MTNKAVLDLSGSTYQDIVQHVLPHGSEYEEAVFIFANHDAGVFTPAGIYFVPPDGFENRSTYFLELTEETQRKVFKQAHDLNASIIEVHSHPIQFVAEFSGSDVYGFREFVPRARWRTKERPYGAVVIARKSFDSLAWFDTIETPVPMDIRLDGANLLQPTACRTPIGERAINIMGTRFQRNEEFFGEQGQQKIRQAACTIVGVGGLGTHVIQQLALLGVSKFYLIDSEELEETNRNRYIGARHDDPVPGSLKVRLGERLIKSIDDDIVVEKVPNNLITPEGFSAVCAADWVFGCLDNEGTRWVLNALCKAYAKPYIDLASDTNVEVNPPEFGGRVVVMAEPIGCLACLGMIDRDEAGRELEGEAGRRNRDAIYGIGQNALGATGPSVVSINGVVASIAVTEFMAAVTGVRRPKRISKYYGHRGTMTVSRDEPTPDCWYCRNSGKGVDVGVERYLD